MCVRVFMCVFVCVCLCMFVCMFVSFIVLCLFPDSECEASCFMSRVSGVGCRIQVWRRGAGVTLSPTFLVHCTTLPSFIVTQTHIHSLTQTHAHTHTNKHTHAHTYTHTHTHTHTHIHTHTHTHTGEAPCRRRFWSTARPCPLSSSMTAPASGSAQFQG